VEVSQIAQNAAGNVTKSLAPKT